jgi:hypothetical protein
MFSSILGSAPVYSFPDSEIFEVDTTDDVLLDVKRVNLDITTMITLVSSITHGGCNFIFREKILSLQAKEERESPVLPELQKYLKGNAKTGRIDPSLSGSVELFVLLFYFYHRLKTKVLLQSSIRGLLDKTYYLSLW